jgi:hypothetical protein
MGFLIYLYGPSVIKTDAGDQGARVPFPHFSIFLIDQISNTSPASIIKHPKIIKGRYLVKGNPLKQKITAGTMTNEVIGKRYDISFLIIPAFT